MSKHWREWEDTVLRNLYPTVGSDIPELERRSKRAICRRAQRLKVKYKGGRWLFGEGCQGPACETPWMEHMGLGLCICCYNTQYYQKNKKKLNAYSRQQYWDNREAILEYQRKYRELARSLR